MNVAKLTNLECDLFRRSRLVSSHEEHGRITYCIFRVQSLPSARNSTSELIYIQIIPSEEPAGRWLEFSRFNLPAGRSCFRADIFVFLLSTRAGGLGINLTAADTVRNTFFSFLFTSLHRRFMVKVKQDPKKYFI